MDFPARRALALAILNGDSRITRKGGQFLGQCCVDPMPLTPAQSEWLEQLALRAGLAVETENV